MIGAVTIEDQFGHAHYHWMQLFEGGERKVLATFSAGQFKDGNWLIMQHTEEPGSLCQWIVRIKK